MLSSVEPRVLASVVRIPEVLIHPHADHLDIVPLPDHSFQSITARGQFMAGDLGILINPGTVVPETDAYSFLWRVQPLVKGTFPSGWIWTHPTERDRRVIHRRFRGEWSHALLMSPSELGLDATEIVIGTDMSDLCEIQPYDEGSQQGWSHSHRTRCTRQHMPTTAGGWLRYLWKSITG